MIVVFVGPPFSGKGTQASLLGDRLDLPVLSMGELIRKAYEEKDPKAIEGFEKYSMKGLHLPIPLKFGFLKERMDESTAGFILDNFPATAEDLEAFINYTDARSLKVDKVFCIEISIEEMLRRVTDRGRKDDNPQIMLKRREVQDVDRQSVIDYYSKKGTFKKLDGAKSIEEIHKEVLRDLGING